MMGQNNLSCKWLHNRVAVIVFSLTEHQKHLPGLSLRQLLALLLLSLELLFDQDELLCQDRLLLRGSSPEMSKAGAQAWMKDHFLTMHICRSKQ